jgi:hypothetical protein
MSDRTVGHRARCAGVVVACGLLLSLHALSTKPPKALAQHHGPGGVFLGAVEDETGG